jgi:cell division protein FtsL
MKKRILQAYKQAPWRVQIQWIGMFLLAVVLISAVAGVYLSINSQAAAAGREIQSLEYQISEMNKEIAELRVDLAIERSTEKMTTRAEALGFKLIDPKEAVYLRVPGYDPDDELILAPPRVNIISESPTLQSSYKLSLWDWFVDNIWKMTGGFSNQKEEVTP